MNGRHTRYNSPTQRTSGSLTSTLLGINSRSIKAHWKTVQNTYHRTRYTHIAISHLTYITAAMQQNQAHSSEQRRAVGNSFNGQNFAAFYQLGPPLHKIRRSSKLRIYQGIQHQLHSERCRLAASDSPTRRDPQRQRSAAAGRHRRPRAAARQRQSRPC